MKKGNVKKVQNARKNKKQDIINKIIELNL